MLTEQVSGIRAGGQELGIASAFQHFAGSGVGRKPKQKRASRNQPSMSRRIIEEQMSGMGLRVHRSGQPQTWPICVLSTVDFERQIDGNSARGNSTEPTAKRRQEEKQYSSCFQNK